MFLWVLCEDVCSDICHPAAFYRARDGFLLIVLVVNQVCGSSLWIKYVDQVCGSSLWIEHITLIKKVKILAYIMQCPILGTVQSALFFTCGRPVHSKAI